MEGETTVLHHLMPLICSPWLYVVVFVAVAIDGFFPVMPSETLVIGLFALSATGSPNVAALLGTVPAGGIAGDQISYRLGRRAGRLTRGRMAEVRQKGERALQRYGGTAILVGRFIPYGRTATTVTAGSAALPAGRFRLFSAVAGVAWSIYAFGLGRAGGATFAHHPLLGAAFGMTLGLLLAAGCALIEKRRCATTEQRPATTAEQRPTTVTEQRPATVTEQRPATGTEQRPATGTEQRGTPVVENGCSALTGNRCSAVIEQCRDTERRTSSSAVLMARIGNSVFRNTPPTRIVGACESAARSS